MTDVKRLLDEATQLPWRTTTEGHASLRAAAGQVTRDLFAVGQSIPGGTSRELRDTFHDLTYVLTEDGARNIALTGNGPKQTANAALIVHAVNHLPDYEAAVDALETMLDEFVLGVDQDMPKVKDARAALRRVRGESLSPTAVLDGAQP